MLARILTTVALALLSATALADKTVVLRGPFEQVLEKKTSESRAQMVADKVAAAAGESRDEVVLLDERCADKTCLSRASINHGADQGIFVSMEQTGMRYEISLFLAYGESSVTEMTGPFSQALEEVKRVVSKSLAEQAQAEPVAPPPEELPEEPSSGEEKLREPTESADAASDGPDPVVFWVSAGVTSALAISFGISEAVAKSRVEDLKDTDPALREQSDWEDMNRAVVTERVFFSLTMAGAATTAVLFFLTDFKSKSARLESIAPAAAQNGGMLILQGSF